MSLARVRSFRPSAESRRLRCHLQRRIRRQPRRNGPTAAGPQQIRYSPLTQINRDNVTTLAAAWTYDTDEPGALQTQPVDRRWRAVRLHHVAQTVRAERGDRRAAVDVRSRRAERRAQPRRHVLARRRRDAGVCGGRGFHLGARREDWATDFDIRHRTAASIFERTWGAHPRRRTFA